MTHAVGERCPAGVPSGVCNHASQSGAETNSPAFVATTSASVIMPIVFCASLVPWLKPM